MRVAPRNACAAPQNLHDQRQDTIVLVAEWASLVILYAIVTRLERRPFFSTTGFLGVAGIAVMLTLLYIWRRNIWPCIALHWLIDGFPLLVIPAFVTLK